MLCLVALATGETRFFGEPVAAVAADSEDAAALAASMIRIDFEELPPVLTIVTASAVEVLAKTVGHGAVVQT